MSGMVGMAASCEECSFVHVLWPTCIACALRPGIGRQAMVLSGMHWRQSVRDECFFAASHLSLQQIVLMMYLWAHDTPQTIMAHETGIDRHETIVDWCNFLRDECKN